MADISAGAVKELRTSTGAGFMDCKRALADASGDIAAATELLRKRGPLLAVKKADREACAVLIAASSPDGAA